ncbi:hypothetical protein [Tenacibaculum aquimarinum]|uniref:hypothetical protein n=1 Tax=Tenacibaculum aquimarinum TaxID=2910675 RepID=UPI001F0AB13B|nr:hypothetical protein [Tenacibaculum aquimarinum]MCH3884383.1 hypothetical protein [Tenacibaculum aquimarinum]
MKKHFFYTNPTKILYQNQVFKPSQLGNDSLQIIDSLRLDKYALLNKIKMIFNYKKIL